MAKKNGKRARKVKNLALAKIKRAAKASTKKKETNGIPIIAAPKDLAEIVDQYAETDVRYKEVRAVLDSLGAELRAKVLPMLEERIERGEPLSSIKVEGRHHTIMLTLQDRWSYITDEALPIAKKILGKKFDELVAPEIIFELKPEVVENEEKLQELIDLLGDRLDEFFNVTYRYRPKKGFLQKIYALFPRARIAKIRDLFRQATPSLRVLS